MKKWLLVALGAVVAGAAAVMAQGSGKLVYNSNASDPDPRKFDEGQVARFQKAYPGINVTHNTVDHEGFKTAIRTYLASDNPPDVLTWFAGNRMRAFAERGLAADIGDVWTKNGFLSKRYAGTLKIQWEICFCPNQLLLVGSLLPQGHLC